MVNKKWKTSETESLADVPTTDLPSMETLLLETLGLSYRDLRFFV
jgi:hypothetical protein